MVETYLKKHFHSKVCQIFILKQVFSSYKILIHSVAKTLKGPFVSTTVVHRGSKHT